MMAVLGGIDMLVLTGGIGENDAATAHAVRSGLSWVPNLEVRTIPSQEDEQIALHAARLSSPRQ
jgi:acetate kinase